MKKHFKAITHYPEYRLPAKAFAEGLCERMEEIHEIFEIYFSELHDLTVDLIPRAFGKDSGTE